LTDAAADHGLLWSDDFLIGIEELDYEHRCLIEDINKLHRELREHVDMDRIEYTLGRILARMQAHFALEEHVMVSQKYPHYPAHKAEHERLLDEYTEFMTKFERGPNLGDQEAIEKVLRQWIVDHILTSDKKMSLMVTSGKQT
jgi:hemerythrin-like metal-binding protein